MTPILGISAVLLQVWLALAPAGAATALDMSIAAEAEQVRPTDPAAAATLYEEMFAATGDPEWLAQAGACHLSAGQYGHAAAYLEQALVAPGRLKRPEDARADLVRALKETAPLTVEVDADADDGEIVVLVERAEDRRLPRLVIRAPITVASAGLQIVPLRLARGTWSVRISTGKQERGARTVVISELASQRLVISPEVRPGTFETSQNDVSERKSTSIDWRANVVRGAGIAGGVVVLAGLGTLSVGQLRFSGRFDRDSADCGGDRLLGCRKDLAKSGMLRAGGASLLGVGAGVAIGGLTGLIREPARRRTAWIAEASVGGAAVLSGSVWLILAARSFTRNNSETLHSGGDQFSSWNDAQNQDEVKKFASQHTAAAAVLGVGAGIAVSAITGLLLERSYGRAKARTTALRSLKLAGGGSPMWSGFLLSGRF